MRVMHDRPTFATLERTGLTGAALVRQELGLTGKGVGVAVIDSGISDSHDDLYRTSPGAFRLRTGGSRIQGLHSQQPETVVAQRAFDDWAWHTRRGHHRGHRLRLER